MENHRFEWDDQKAALNSARHGLSFDDAATAIDDPAGIEVADLRRDYGAARFRLIAKAWDGKILAVIFTERGERIRIISARLANKKERDFYAQT
jgi:uncharacterized DUF497 family protein